MNCEMLINEFVIEKQCEFKGRTYKVRDNGSVMRIPIKNCKPKGLDNQWSFGRKNKRTGYMMYANVRVHQIVATAFHGAPSDSKMVIDHKDTNRCNNRPENLSWVTRFENVMNNPITRRKISMICGSVEEFLSDPSKFKLNFRAQNLAWMCTVSKGEAAHCRKNLERWAAEDKRGLLLGNGISNWVFQDFKEAKCCNLIAPPQVDTDQRHTDVRVLDRCIDESHTAECNIVQSLTSTAIQEDWKTPCVFHQCPLSVSSTPLKDYLANLRLRAPFCSSKYYSNFVAKVAASSDGKILWVVTYNPGAEKKWALAEIKMCEGRFLHSNLHQFFSKNGVRKSFTLAQGLKWTGGDSIDDFC